MAQPTQPLEAAQEPPDKDEAFERLRKSILRRRAVDQLVAAIRRDLASLPKTSVMARRSVKVLDYMRGYITAVDEELTAATDNYENAIYAARVEHDKTFKLERKRNSTLGRRTVKPTAPTEE